MKEQRRISRKEKGFTLIELLIVITVIAILAGAAFVALNPGQRLQDARDSTRWQDVSAVLGGAKLDQLDNGGAYHTTVSTITGGELHMIGTGGAGGCTDACADGGLTDTDCRDLTFLVTEGYLASVPIALTKSGGGVVRSAAQTGYYISRASTDTLEIGACDSENTDGISVAK